MRITLKTFGVLESMIKEEAFAFPEKEGIRLDHFFRFLMERCGSGIGEHLLPGGAFNSHYFIFINGKNIRLLKDMETELRDGDRIFITTLVDGG